MSLFVSSHRLLRVHLYTSFLYRQEDKEEGDNGEMRNEKRSKKKKRSTREKKIEKKKRKRCLFRVWDFFLLSLSPFLDFSSLSEVCRHIQKSSSLFVTVLWKRSRRNSREEEEEQTQEEEEEEEWRRWWSLDERRRR